jgi:tyrosyl-tRNA synthetase
MTSAKPPPEIEAEVERQLEVMRDGAVDLHGETELRTRLAAALQSKRPLRVKLGMDPSAPDLHLGHTVVLQKLKRLQGLGHTPIFLIGDFTAMIGDPSGKKKTRPALDREEVKRNAATYVDQVGRILDVGAAEVRFNSEWMDPLVAADVVRLCSHYTVARLLERDDFAKRYRGGDPISVHELLYPFVQAYDSVALRSDIELGGTDQTFNLLMAREIQRDYGQPAQAVITHPLLVGLDGREKMSKSLGNTIGIVDPPEEMYGKVMSLSDAVMLDYYDALAAGAWEDLRTEREDLGRGEGEPLAFKHALAAHIVARFHDGAAARVAEAHFRRVVQRREVPDEVPSHAFALADDGRLGLLEILEKLAFARSRSEGRRLVAQRAVQVDGEVVSDPTLYLGAGAYLIRAGRRKYARVALS